MAVIAARISGGRSAASSAGLSPSIPPIASTCRDTIGSQSLDQTGRVASTHSERLQAWIVLIPLGNSVASSSHRSASRSASVTWLRSLSSTLGSPLAATAWRAMFLARSQLTGPPCQDIRSANCRSASASCCGSPSGPSGPPAPWPPEPGPPEPDRSTRASRALVRVTGHPKAEGRVSHLRGLSGRMEESMLAKLSRERWVVSNRDAEVRRGRSARRGRGQPPGAGPRLTCTSPGRPENRDANRVAAARSWP